MLKDFPSAIFTSEKIESDRYDEFCSDTEAFYSYDISENVSKLEYSHKLNITYDPIENTPKCLTQMNYSSDHLNKISPLLPWKIPNRIDKGYDLYFDLSKQVKLEKKSYVEYYHADCKSTLGKFIPNLFVKGTSGNCIYTEGVWMTPVQFQAYSGSTGADWRSAIQLRRPNESKSKNSSSCRPLTIKSLVDDGTLSVHSSTCQCSKCRDCYIMQDQSVNLIVSFFINSGQQLVLAHPNANNTNLVDIDIRETILNKKTFDNDYDISEILKPINRSNMKKTPSKSQTLKGYKYECKKAKNLKIKQIECTTFDECNDYFNSKKVAENVMEAYIALNYGDSKLQSYVLELNDENFFNTRLLYELDVRDDYIGCIAASHLIREECAIVLDRSGDIYLANEASMQNGRRFIEESDSLKIATDLQPIFVNKLDAESNWRSIKFGSQPRQFIYSDHSQLLSIDSRVRNLQNNSHSKLFTSDSINGNEFIQRTQMCDNDYFTHLICTSNRLVVIDERFISKPLLTWRHHLKNPCIFLTNTRLNSSSGKNDYSHLIAYSDSYDLFANQFSTKHGMYVSHNFTKKLESPKDVKHSFPDDYDKRLNKHLKHRLERPVIGMSTLKYKNSLAIFQMQQNCDIFYQCFKTSDNESEDSVKKSSSAKKWLEEIKTHAMPELNLERRFDELSVNNKDRSDVYDLNQLLPPQSENCALCNESKGLNMNMEFDEKEICSRCGNSVFYSHSLINPDLTAQWKDYHSIDSDVFNGLKIVNDINLDDDFTKELYSEWNEVKPDTNMTNKETSADRSKRLRLSSLN